MKKLFLFCLLLIASFAIAGELEDGFMAREKKEYEKAYSLFSKLCDGGNLDGCVQIGSMYDSAELPNITNPEKAALLYKKACDGKNYTGCLGLGFMYDSGAGVAKDKNRALELYLASCDNGIMSGCYYAAEKYKYQLDLNKSVTLYQKACYGGEGSACTKACDILLPNGAYKETLKLSKKAYEIGNPDGYLYLGVHYQYGYNAKQDIKKAKELYEQACQKGSYLGCSNLGALYTFKELKDIKEDYAKAIQYFQEACSNNIDIACKNLGDMYSGGFGVEKDTNKASELWEKSAKLYEKSCYGGNPASCYSYAKLYSEGSKVKQDYIKSAQFYEYACDWNNTAGCNSLGVQYNNGEGVKQDIDNAIKYFEKACDNKNALGCINLAKKYEFNKNMPQTALSYYNEAVKLDLSYKQELDKFNKRQRDKKDKELQKQKELANFRNSIKEGSKTNCGPVLETKKAMIKVYFPIANYGNEHWIERDKIYPTQYGCKFLNGQYTGTGE